MTHKAAITKKHLSSQAYRYAKTEYYVYPKLRVHVLVYNHYENSFSKAYLYMINRVAGLIFFRMWREISNKVIWFESFFLFQFRTFKFLKNNEKKCLVNIFLLNFIQIIFGKLVFLN